MTLMETLCLAQSYVVHTHRTADSLISSLANVPTPSWARLPVEDRLRDEDRKKGKEKLKNNREAMVAY